MFKAQLPKSIGIPGDSVEGLVVDVVVARRLSLDLRKSCRQTFVGRVVPFHVCDD